MAATHGVYKRQKTKNETAASGVSKVVIEAPESRTDKVEATLSFAIKPAIREVQIRQSLNPRGANIGAI